MAEYTQMFYPTILQKSCTSLFTRILGDWIHYIIEVVLLVLVYVLFKRKSSLLDRIQRCKLTKTEEEKLLDDWESHPLVPLDFKPLPHVSNPFIVHNVSGKYITFEVDDSSNPKNLIKCHNLASFNTYGFIGKTSIAESAVNVIKTCGMGSCGPRHFFGTNEFHIKLEDKISEFLGQESTISICFGFLTTASAIPSYAKMSDIIFCDEYVNMSIQLGIKYSKATVYWYKHNNMDSLEQLIRSVFSKLCKNKKEFQSTRCFIVTEAVFYNYGDIVDLKRLLEIKKKYKIRVFIDESLSFGMLGKTGRGISEYYNVDIQDIDLISASLETCVGSVGGFCSGSKYIIERQRLSSAGYVFSAAQPPMYAQVGIESIDELKNNPVYVKKLQDNSQLFYESLVVRLPLKYSVHGIPPSCVYHIRMLNPSTDRNEDLTHFENAHMNLITQFKVAVCCCRYLDKNERYLHPPSLRIIMNALLDEDDIQFCVDSIVKVLQ